MVIVEDFKSLSYSEELFSTWTYRYATEILNTDKIPLKELTEQVDFVNSYKGAVVIKVLKTENIDEEKKFIEKKLSRDKHFKDFTQKEMNYLYMLTDNIIYNKGTELSDHGKYRVYNRLISFNQLVRALSNYQLVEFREIHDDYNTESDARVTIRSNFRYELDRICRFIYVVISLNTGKIVTVYASKSNRAKYNNSNLKRYDKDLDIIESIKRSKKMKGS